MKIANKQIPFTLEQISELTKEYPTPFYIYDEKAIRESVRNLFKAFSWNNGFKLYFPIKANANPHLFKILHEEGANADCCSIPELMIAERNNLKGESIILTSNDTGSAEFIKAMDLRTIINLDDPNHLEYLENIKGLPEVLCLRYNPGPIFINGKETWGHLTEDKFGMTKDQIIQTYNTAKEKGIKRFGLHMMIMSNDIHSNHIIDTVDFCFNLAEELLIKHGVELEFIDLGGGIGIPYKPSQRAIDINIISNQIKEKYFNLIQKSNIKPFKIFLETGRLVIGPHGYLVSKVRHIKESYKTYVGLDSSMADLMRPGMYGSYHHISVLGKESVNEIEKYDVVGSLCENIDKFAINRELPKLTKNDVVVMHDVGAYGRSKVFNFNGKLRPAEFLLKLDGSFEMIRRAETVEDYFSTITNWSK